VQGTIQNPVSGSISPSLYHNSAPGFLAGYPFPPIGPEYPINSYSIPARDRYLAGTPLEVPTCLCYQNLTSNNLNGNYISSHEIESTGKVQSGSNTVFDAGYKVDLKPGFEVKAGGEFEGFIDGCDD